MELKCVVCDEEQTNPKEMLFLYGNVVCTDCLAMLNAEYGRGDYD